MSAAEKLWFQQTIEGLLRGVGDQLTPSLRRKLLAVGLDIEVLRPAYPATLVAQAVRVIASELFPTLGVDAAEQQVGEMFLRGYAQTLVGRAMVQVVRLIGPTRTLQRMTRNFRTGGNYIETRFASLGRSKAELWVSDTSGMPAFYAGMLVVGGEYARARDLRVSFTNGDAGSTTYIVEWAE